MAVAIIGRDAAEEERQGDDELLHGCVSTVLVPARRNVSIHRDAAAAGGGALVSPLSCAKFCGCVHRLAAAMPRYSPAQVRGVSRASRHR